MKLATPKRSFVDMVPLVYAGGVHQNEQEDAMNMRGPGGIIGVIVVIVVIFLLLRLLGLV